MYSTREAAEYLNMSFSLVKKLMREGKLDAVAVGRGRRKIWQISQEALDALKRDRETNPPKRGWGASASVRKVPRDAWQSKKEMPEITDKLLQKFSKHVDRSGDCWIWRGPKNPSGYGYTSWKGKHFYAHRLSYYLHTMIDPGDNDVLHSCDNPYCVNPEHLHLGNDMENSKEKFDRNRQRYFSGEKHPMAKLTEDQVREIRKLAMSGISQREISERFGISQSHICTIVLRKKWSLIE